MGFKKPLDATKRFDRSNSKILQSTEHTFFTISVFWLGWYEGRAEVLS